MTEALAVEWSKSYINVNAIAPGAFSSEMLDGMIERVGDFSQTFPRKRICTPEQMDSTLLFLVSPSSECVTGTCIKIDDENFRATNPGVWVYYAQELKDRKKFTSWEDYGKDQPIILDSEH